MTVSCVLFLLIFYVHASAASAEEVRAAVASNFLATFHEIAKIFEHDTGHVLAISSGSSGKLYAQVQHGAPFDVFFSADSKRPRLMEQEALAVPESRFTYAVGRLTLWSANPALINGDGQTVLSQGRFEHVAIANPKTAPYGVAAKHTLERLGVWPEVERRIVQGENIGQTFQFVYSQNAQLGFVALSQVLSPKINGAGSRWDVPVHLHRPLTQQAVLLVNGQRNQAAVAFLEYVKAAKAQQIIERFGYGVEEKPHANE
ncbi:MAG: molybdate-binding periplasmic protein ModA [Nitrospirales bacterium]|nr:MAG: molybdate-binding periplasmic protein ModA [Nitrospirales bacterium]